MRLIGLVTFLSVNIQLVSEGNNGCFAEVLLPPSWEIHQWLVSCVCRVPRPRRDCRFFKGHLHSKALKMLEVVFSWRCPLISDSSDAFIPKEVTHYMLLQWKWMCIGTPTLSLMIQWSILFCLFFNFETKTNTYLNLWWTTFWPLLYSQHICPPWIHSTISEVYLKCFILQTIVIFVVNTAACC